MEDAAGVVRRIILLWCEVIILPCPPSLSNGSTVYFWLAAVCVCVCLCTWVCVCVCMHVNVASTSICLREAMMPLYIGYKTEGWGPAACICIRLCLRNLKYSLSKILVKILSDMQNSNTTKQKQQNDKSSNSHNTSQSNTKEGNERTIWRGSTFHADLGSVR